MNNYIEVIFITNILVVFSLVTLNLYFMKLVSLEVEVESTQKQI